MNTIVCCSSYLQAPMPKCSSKARVVWKLQHRLDRLIAKAKNLKGTSMDLIWFEYASVIDETIDQLQSLGVEFVE